MENIFATHATGLDCDLSLKEYFEKHGSEIARTRKWKPVVYSGTYKTLKMYTGYLEDLSRHLPDKSISTMTFFDLQRGLEKVQTDNHSGKRYADSTMKSFRSMLNDIYWYAQNRNDAYNIISYFSTRLSKDKSNITPIQSILDPTLSAEEILARTRRALEGRRYLPRSLNLTQQAHLTRCLVENVKADGRYCGLGIILYGGLRPAEVRKILWGDLVPFLDHPDRLMMYLYETRNASGQVEDHMKTPNAYRKVPVHMELHRLLMARKQFVEGQLLQQGSKLDINDLPVCCFKNEFSCPCREHQLSILGADVLKSLAITAKDLEGYLLDMTYNAMTSKNKTDEDESHLSLYVLRRNFWTWMQSSTQLSEMERKYLMGHEMVENDQDLRARYNDEDKLWGMLQKMDKHLISFMLRGGGNEITPKSGVEINFANKGYLPLRLTPEQLAAGGRFTIRITSEEVNDSVGIFPISDLHELYDSPIEVYGKVTSFPSENKKQDGINCEFDDYTVSSELRRRMGKVIKTREKSKE